MRKLDSSSFCSSTFSLVRRPLATTRARPCSVPALLPGPFAPFPRRSCAWRLGGARSGPPPPAAAPPRACEPAAGSAAGPPAALQCHRASGSPPAAAVQMQTPTPPPPELLPPGRAHPPQQPRRGAGPGTHALTARARDRSVRASHPPFHGCGHQTRASPRTRLGRAEREAGTRHEHTETQQRSAGQPESAITGQRGKCSYLGEAGPSAGCSRGRSRCAGSWGCRTKVQIEQVHLNGWRCWQRRWHGSGRRGCRQPRKKCWEGTSQDVLDRSRLDGCIGHADGWSGGSINSQRSRPGPRP